MDAEQRAEAAKNNLYKKCPRLTEIDMQISSLGARLAIAALGGGDLGELRESITLLSEERSKIIAENGVDEADFTPKYRCGECGDSGYVHGRLCSCVEELCKKIICENMSAQMPLDSSRFDNFDLSFYPEKGEKVSPRGRMQSILEFCREYADGFTKHSGSILFLGKTGLGKTHLSLAIAGAVIEKGYSVIYGPSVKLLGRVEKEHFGTAQKGEYLDRLLECDLLIIDDLGTEFINSFSVSVINNIINSRILENRATIISTNFTLSELEEKYSPRVTSRFIGNYAIKQFLGNDIRQQKLKR